MTVTVFVPDIPEFLPLIEGARNSGNANVAGPHQGYWTISAADQLTFERRKLGIGPALWNSALTGGFVGRIEEYGRDVMRLVSA